mmetsp:Transcript_509/g.1122  ORF Transcript_509/g.1122 Transcript_509/m.1122 type:complete len:262 (+) Transcript_509:158-943(+)
MRARARSSTLSSRWGPEAATASKRQRAKSRRSRSSPPPSPPPRVAVRCCACTTSPGWTTSTSRRRRRPRRACCRTSRGCTWWWRRGTRCTRRGLSPRWQRRWSGGGKAGRRSSSSATRPTRSRGHRKRGSRIWCARRWRASTLPCCAAPLPVILSSRARHRQAAAARHASMLPPPSRLPWRTASWQRCAPTHSSSHARPRTASSTRPRKCARASSSSRCKRPLARGAITRGLRSARGSPARSTRKARVTRLTKSRQRCGGG